MKFLNLKTNKSMFLAFMLTLGLSLAGCEIDENYNDLGSLEDASSSHQTSIETELDLDADYVIEAEVHRVVDGDTIEIVLPDGEIVDTRLLLIDTPETKHPDLGVQKFGPEASEFAKSVFEKGDTVYFELDSGDATDKYGRYLGYLWYTCKEDSQLEMYNQRVVEEGLARVGYIYEQTKHLDALSKTQELAKSSNKNIWSIDGYVTDRGFDMNKVSDDSSSETSQTSNDDIIYANGNSNSSSSVYHKTSDAHNMKSSIEMTKSEAESKGLKPCSNCFK